MGNGIHHSLSFDKEYLDTRQYDIVSRGFSKIFEEMYAFGLLNVEPKEVTFSVIERESDKKDLVLFNVEFKEKE